MWLYKGYSKIPSEFDLSSPGPGNHNYESMPSCKTSEPSDVNAINCPHINISLSNRFKVSNSSVFTLTVKNHLLETKPITQLLHYDTENISQHPVVHKRTEAPGHGPQLQQR